MICEPQDHHLVWLDGEFVRWHDATMHVSSHHYGYGVFEGVRSYAGKDGTGVFRLHEHTQRLLHSAHIMKIAVPRAYDCERLNRAQLELLRKNGLHDAYLRPFVFYAGARGIKPATRGLSVHIAIWALEWKAGKPHDGADTSALGLALRTSSFARHASMLSKAKANGNYVTGMLALEEAQASGADEALLLDQNGYVAETSGANFFVVRNGALYTPPASSVLEGITRETVLTLAAAAGFTVKECLLSRDDVYVADEAFLTGTAMEVMPVRELDGRRIGSGSPGPITERLRAMYAAQVRGRGERHSEWLTPV